MLAQGRGDGDDGLAIDLKSWSSSLSRASTYGIIKLPCSPCWPENSNDMV